MVTYQIVDALSQLEKEWAMEPPMGASDLGLVERYLMVVSALRDRICPRLSKLTAILGSNEAALVAGLVDVVGPACSDQPLLVGSLYRGIVMYGVDKFCRDPAGLLKGVNTENSQ